MKAGELFVELGVKADTFTVRDFAKAIGDIPFSVAGAITSLTGLSLGFFELTTHTLELSNNLGIFRSQTGLSIEDLQRWQAVAKQVGVSGQVVQSSIMGITQAMAAMRTGHPDTGFMLSMGQLGVDIRGKNAFQIMKDVMEKSRGKDASVVSDMLSRAHISPEMMRIFSLSSGQFNRMASVGPTLNENDQRAMQDFQAALARFTIIIEKSFVPALAEIEPYMKDLAEVLGDVVKMAGAGAGGALSLLHDAKEMHKSGMPWVFANPLSLMAPRIASWMLTQQRDPGEFNVTQHIHSTADPEDVANIAVEHFKREKTRASKQFNNSGY